MTNIYLDIDGVLLANDKNPAKHADEFAGERHDRAVEDAGDARQGPPSYYRVGVVTPDDIGVAGRFGLPRQVGNRRTGDRKLHEDDKGWGVEKK